MILIAKIILYPSLIIFAIILLPLLVIKKLTPKLTKNNISQVGNKCVELFQLKHLQIDFKLKKDIEYSQVKVIIKNKKYIVIIKDNWLNQNASEIIHELTHIKKGQSDKMKDQSKGLKGYFINFYFDLCFAWPNEVRYFLWVRKNCI